MGIIKEEYISDKVTRHDVLPLSFLKKSARGSELSSKAFPSSSTARRYLSQPAITSGMSLREASFSGCSFIYVFSVIPNLIGSFWLVSVAIL